MFSFYREYLKHLDRDWSLTNSTKMSIDTNTTYFHSLRSFYRNLSKMTSTGCLALVFFVLAIPVGFYLPEAGLALGLLTLYALGHIAWIGRFYAWRSYEYILLAEKVEIDTRRADHPGWFDPEFFKQKHLAAAPGKRRRPLAEKLWSTFPNFFYPYLDAKPNDAVEHCQHP